MGSINRLAAIASVVALGPLCSEAADEVNQPSNGEQLETIIVTADKREEKLTDVPMSVTALSGNSLDVLQDRDFSSFAALVPGLSINSAQPGQTRLTLRGQNVGGDGSTVAVYVDESPFGSSAALTNGAVSSGDFDTWDVQRVEVLRGPQGTLYGSNSEGGLLKFVTNAPVLGSFSGAAELNGETTDHGGHGGDVHAMLNLPLGDKLALRVSGFDADVPGFINDPAQGKKDINEGHKEGGRASLLAQATEDLSIRLTATFQESRYNGTNVVDVDPTTLTAVQGDLAQDRFVAEPSEIRYTNYNGTINWNAGPFTVVSSTSYGLINTDLVSDYTSVAVAPGTTLGELLGALVGPNLGGRLDNNVTTTKFTQEVRISSPASDHFEWQAGAYFTHEIGTLIQNLDAVQLPSGLGAPVAALEVPTLMSDYKEWAGFADATYRFNSHFDIQGGLRYSKNEQDATESISGLLVGGLTSFSTPSQGHFVSYSVAPQWHIDDNSMLYARVATGFRPGGPNPLPPGAPVAIPREYNSDRTTNYEIGARSTQLDGRLSIDLAAFYTRWTDVQLLEQVDQTGIDGNGGTARSEGVEWTFTFVPLQGLTVQWNGAYTDAILTSPAPAVNGEAGNPLPYVPRWSTSINGDYTTAPLFGEFKGFVGATWSFVDSRDTDFMSSVAGGQVQLPSYDTIDLRFGVDNGHYRVSLYGKNLADSRAITAFLNQGSPAGAGQATVIDPRMIGLTLSAKF